MRHEKGNLDGNGLWCIKAIAVTFAYVRQIAALYDTLAVMAPSVVIEVNRAMAWGVRAGLEMLLRLDSQAAGFYPYHAARADLLRRAGQREAAAEAYERAPGMCSNAAERALSTNAAG